MPLGKAANRTSDQAREGEGDDLPDDVTADAILRTFAVFHYTRNPVYPEKS